MKLTLIRTCLAVVTLGVCLSASAQQPKSAKEYFDRAVAHAQNGNLEAALEDVEKAIRLNGAIPQLYGFRGSIYFAKHDFDAAFRDFSKVIDLAPQIKGIEVIYNNRAVIRVLRGDYAAALRDVEQALTVNPDYINSLNLRGNLRQINEDFDGAIADFDRAISLDPTYADPYVGRGNIRSDRGDSPGALNDYDRAIELKPNDPAAYVGRAIIHFQRGDLRAALLDSNRIIELDPANSKSYFKRGVIKVLMGDADTGLEDIKRAFKIDPAVSAAAPKKSFITPGELLDQFIAGNPRNARGYEARGIVRLIHGNESAARFDFRRAIEIDPTLKDEVTRLSTRIVEGRKP